MSETAWAYVRLARSGTGLVLGDSDGTEQPLSYQRLALELGLAAWQPGDALPCLATPQIVRGALELTVDGNAHRLDQAALHKSKRVLRNATIARCDRPDLGVINDGAIVIDGDRIAWLGKDCDLGASGFLNGGDACEDLQGRLLTPGLVDCHAHPLFAGDRATEFAQRARGEDYLEIAKRGGGINATVQPTRTASLSEHVNLCGRRMQHALAWGTTTMEAKSGYDLSEQGELRLLRVASIVSGLQAIDLEPTLLGAHAIPPEYTDDRAGFLSMIIDSLIPQVAKEQLASAVDVYCDQGAFTLSETRSILTCAKRRGLNVKAHIGQFADLGGAELLAELGALSGDHLEQVSDQGIAAMAKANVVATMLPGACVQLGMTPPPVEKLRRAGVKLAIGSDLNPGTSHSESLVLPMWLACTHYSMSVEEAWLGVTQIGAQALGRADIGTLSEGRQADMVIWNTQNYAEIPYHFGVNLVHQVIKGGRRA